MAKFPFFLPSISQSFNHATAATCQKIATTTEHEAISREFIQENKRETPCEVTAKKRKEMQAPDTLCLSEEQQVEKSKIEAKKTLRSG